MKTVYEWDYETWDEFDDVMDHDHADKLSEFTEARKTNHLVLIRETGSEASGLDERYWAYVSGGKLPEYFKDSLGNDTQYKVPKIFHEELAKHITNP